MTEEELTMKDLNPKLITYIITGVIIGLLILAAHNYGYGRGYTYVNDYKNEYIEENCICFNNTKEEVVPLFNPIEENKGKKLFASE